jgi:hypothetical protein
MDEQVSMAFNVAGIVAIEVDEMGVEGEGGEAEEKMSVGSKTM